MTLTPGAPGHPPPPPAASLLLDLHCHGALGAEFGGAGRGPRGPVLADGTLESDRRAAEFFAAQGSLVVASLVSAPPAVLVRQVRHLAPLVAAGVLLGIHLEGPFLSPVRRGAHDPRVLADPDPALVETLAQAADEAGAPGAIRQWTYAPELPGASELERALAGQHIRAAIGHTDAPAATVSAAIARNTALTGEPVLITHLCNGMSPLHHRAGGPVAAALAAAARDEAVVELIADGVHLAAEVVRMVFDLLGGHRIALVSDAMSATGLGDGTYMLGGLEVGVRDGAARLANGSLAGSTATLARCARWAREEAGVAEAEVRAATADTPRRLLRL